MASETHKKVEWEITTSPGLFGYVLIFFGIVLFLQNFGWLDFSWSDFWRLWPLLLVFCGIAVIPMKNWLKQVLAIFCVIGALFILLKTPNFGDGYAFHPNGETELKACEKECEKSKDKELAPVEAKPVVPPPPAARPARPVAPPPQPPVAVDSTLILDVSLLNLDPNDGLRDRSVFGRTMFGGIAGVSVYREGGLVLNRRGGAVPKWEFNRHLANVTLEFDVKLFSKPRGHGITVSFVEYPETGSPASICLTFRARNEVGVFFPDIPTFPNFPLNAWTRVRVEVGDPVGGKVDIKLYLNDVLKSSGQSTYVDLSGVNLSNIVFPYVALTVNAWFNHDRADAAIRNLRVWLTK